MVTKDSRKDLRYIDAGESTRRGTIVDQVLEATTRLDAEQLSGLKDPLDSRTNPQDVYISGCRSLREDDMYGLSLVSMQHMWTYCFNTRGPCEVLEGPLLGHCFSKRGQENTHRTHTTLLVF